jgi:peptidylprolyl isomerase
MRVHDLRNLITSLLLASCHAAQTPPLSPDTPPPQNVVIPAPSGSAASDEPAPVDDVAPARTSERTTESGLRIAVLRDGSGPSIESGRRVRIHYVGTLQDGSVFDSSRERGTPMEVELGKGYLIKGFEEGIAGMRVGEVRRLTIPPELGYGERSVGSKIPPNSTLVFEVELVEAL